MLERELKLHVPGVSREALKNELLELGATRLALRARYFDTSERALAKAGIALRLRLEGDTWVQTLKAPGPDELSRIELNHNRNEPELDLDAYQGTPVESLLEPSRDALHLCYETDISRLVLRQDTGAGLVEFAYDTGCVKAADQQLEICELELEQISAPTADLFTLSKRWLNNYELIVDLRSKAERGDLLAHSLPRMLEPRRAWPLAHKLARQAGYELYSAECVNQIIRNATFAAGVDTQGATLDQHMQYVRQLRVGIRRLSSCWALLGKPAGLEQPPTHSELQRYSTLLRQAPDVETSRALVASKAFQSCLLALLEQLLALNEHV